MFLIGDTHRSISSTALGISERSAASCLELVGMAQELEHATADHVTGSLVASDQDQQRLVDDRRLVQSVAVDFGVDQRPDQVVGLIVAASLLGDRGDVRRVLERRLGGLVHGARVRRPQRLEHVIGPPQEIVAILRGHAQHVADHDHGQRGSDLPDEIGGCRPRRPDR